MSDKVVVIIATRDGEKARTGLMYATNALKHGWLSDVKLFLFGPAEAAILDDADTQEMLAGFHRLGQTAVACRFIADRDGTGDELSEMGVDVQHVGGLISDLIKDGYVPMVW